MYRFPSSHFYEKSSVDPQDRQWNRNQEEQFPNLPTPGTWNVKIANQHVHWCAKWKPRWLTERECENQKTLKVWMSNNQITGLFLMNPVPSNWYEVNNARFEVIWGFKVYIHMLYFALPAQ